MRILLQFGATLLLMALAFAFAPPIFSGDYDTARNYLSTIAATLATIL
ncbi:MAG: hypothetical protein JWN30_778, partial [Bacilli bacterium]|nr:hypothetical protein [Bacilli bacterium]